MSVHPRSVASRWLGRLLALVLLLAGWGLHAAPAAAVAVTALPEQPPADHVLDSADLLSRSALGEVSRALDGFAQQGINATWVSIPRLDYGISTGQFADQLLQRWQAASTEQLLFLIDAQTSGTAVVASPQLSEQITPELLRSTARTTMAQPLREGGRYRQASLAAMQRIAAVLGGEADPGEPLEAVSAVTTARVPSREQTEASHAFTWVAVLLVVGTIVPMLTWWVFSR